MEKAKAAHSIELENELTCGAIFTKKEMIDLMGAEEFRALENKPPIDASWSNQQNDIWSATHNFMANGIDHIARVSFYFEKASENCLDAVDLNWDKPVYFIYPQKIELRNKKREKK